MDEQQQFYYKTMVVNTSTKDLLTRLIHASESLKRTEEAVSSLRSKGYRKKAEERERFVSTYRTHQEILTGEIEFRLFQLGIKK